MLVDEELDRWCCAVTQDRTFERLLAQLDPREVREVQQLVGREVVLWSLVDAPEDSVWHFVERLGSDARASFEEDLELMDRRDDDAPRREWRIAEARLLAIDAARLVLQFRALGARPPRR